MTAGEGPPRRRRRAGWLWLAVIAVLVGGGVTWVQLASENGHQGRKAAQPSPSPSVLGETFDKPGASASPGSGGASVQEPGRALKVTGTSPQGLGPGVTRPVTVTVTNPNDQPVTLTAVAIVVGDGSSECRAQGNIAVTSYLSTAPGAVAYVAPAGGQVNVPLSITMLDTSTNQDFCKNVSFPLTFSASGHEA